MRRRPHPAPRSDPAARLHPPGRHAPRRHEPGSITRRPWTDLTRPRPSDCLVRLRGGDDDREPATDGFARAPRPVAATRSIATSEGDVVAGRYRIAGQLGRDEMAEFWLAATSPRRQVTLKLFRVSGHADDARGLQPTCTPWRACRARTWSRSTTPGLTADGRSSSGTGRRPTLTDRIAAPGGVKDVELAAIGAEPVAAPRPYPPAQHRAPRRQGRQRPC